jgi:hypothetical protein
MKSVRSITVGVPFVLAAIAIPPTSATAAVKCPGSFQTLGSYTYTVSELTVANTSCAAGKKLAQKIPPYRVLKPRHVDGFLCAAVGHYAGARPTNGGYQAYTCRKGARTVKWHVAVPSEL